MMFFYFKASL